MVMGWIFLAIAAGGWAWYYRQLPPAIRYLGMYLVLNLIIQLAASWIAYYADTPNNLPLLHLNTLLEFIFFSLFFREVYIDVLIFKRYFGWWLGGGSLLLMANSFFWEPIWGFNTVAKAAVQLCLIAYVILYFFDAFGRVDLTERVPQVFSLLCSAILLYYAGSLFIFMIGQWIIQEAMGEAFEWMWTFNAIFSSLFQLVAMVSVYRLAWRGRPPWRREAPPA